MLTGGAAADEAELALDVPVDLAPIEALAYRMENCGPGYRIRAAFLDVREEVLLAGQYVLSEQGDQITVHISPFRAQTSSATASVVLTMGPNAVCVVAASRLPMGEGDAVGDTPALARFDFHLTVFFAPEPGQLFLTKDLPSDEARVAQSYEILGRITVGNGSFVATFLRGPDGTGALELKGPKYAAYAALATYGAE